MLDLGVTYCSGKRLISFKIVLRVESFFIPVRVLCKLAEEKVEKIDFFVLSFRRGEGNGWEW